MLAAFQKAFSPSLPNALHLALLPSRTGLHTRPLSFGALALDATLGEVVLTTHETEARFALNGHSPRSLQFALIASLVEHGIGGTETVKPSDDESPFAFDPTDGAGYAEALSRIYTSMARVRGEWMGAVTPMVVWPHGFDLSTLYFPGQNPDEHTQPHINIGFSPRSAGFVRPYIYAYAWPMPDDARATALPSPARWTTDGWTGVVIDYDELQKQDRPDEVLETALREIFQRLAAWL